MTFQDFLSCLFFFITAGFVSRIGMRWFDWMVSSIKEILSKRKHSKN